VTVYFNIGNTDNWLPGEKTLKNDLLEQNDWR